MVGFRGKKKTCQIPPQVLNKTDFRTLEIGDDTFVLVLISTIWAQRTKWTLTRALIGGAQPMEDWWAPVAQPHKRR